MQCFFNLYIYIVINIRGSQALNWEAGEYAGLILCGREDNLEKGDDSGFLSFTLTRAKSGNVYTRWGTYKRYKSQKIGQKVIIFGYW